MEADGATRIGWIVSYPKSGNTWLRLMLSSLMNGGQPLDINTLGNDIGVATHTELDELLVVESSELFMEEQLAVQPLLNAAIANDTGNGLVLRKVHDRFWRTLAGEAVFPASVSRAAVYMARDPRDVAVSYAHHRGCSIDEIITIMADPSATLSQSTTRQRNQLAQPLGDWSSHALSWLEQTDIPVMLLRYEDLAAAPETWLRAVAAHLGLPADDRCVSGAVAATRFDVLRAQEQEHGFKERRVGSTAPFFRQGKVGDWHRRLTPEQVARIEADHHPVMARLGYSWAPSVSPPYQKL
jgi:aryl sulfotransferase